MSTINQESQKPAQKASDSFMIEEFFKGQKDIFNANVMYNQAIIEDDPARNIKNDDSRDDQDASTKEDDPQHIKELSNEQNENSDTERSLEYSENAQNKQKLNFDNQTIVQGNRDQKDGYQQEEVNRNHYDYDENCDNKEDFQVQNIQKNKIQDKERDEENKRALLTFKQLLSKSNHNIDDSVEREEIVPFQYDISQIDPKYEQNHTYNLDNDNTEYILRNAEKYLDSPNYYQEDQNASNYKQQQFIPEDCRGDFVDQLEDKQKDNLFISQIQAQKQIQEQQRFETEDNEISFHQQQNNFYNQADSNRDRNQENKKEIAQDNSPLIKSDSQVTFERCQNIEKIIEEYERSIQNLSQVEEQPAVLRSRSDLKLQPRSSSRLRDQQQQDNNSNNNRIDTSSSSSISQLHRENSPIAITSKQTSNVNISSKPPKDNNFKRDSNPKLANQESINDKDIKFQFQISLLESENKDLKQQIHQVQLEKEALQLKMDRLELKNESLTKTLTQLKEKLSLVASIDSEIQANLEILSVQNQELELQNEQSQQQVKTLNNQNNALHIENKNLLESIKNMKTQIQYFQTKLDERFDTFNAQSITQNIEFKEQIKEKIQLVKQGIEDYIHSTADLNQISKEVLKAYAPQKLQAKIDAKIKQIEKNSLSSKGYVDQALDNMFFQINEFCTNNSSS